MKNPEPTIRIKVNVTNPGQFFGCCGLLELADRLCPGTEAWFDDLNFNLCTKGTLREILSRLTCDVPVQLEKVFVLWRPFKGSFGFDSLAAWNALDLGFSPNDQKMAVNSSPASELLSAIGLQRFRPLVSANRSVISYATWSVPASALVAST